MAAWAQAGVGMAAMERSDYERPSPTWKGSAILQSVDADYGVALVFTFLGMVKLIRVKEDEATAMLEKGCLWPAG